MSNYGSYPGPPQEPWPGRQPQEPYGQPADPWGGQQPDPWGGTPSSTPPGGPGSPTGDPGYYPGYDQGGYQEPGPGYGPGPAYGSTRQYEPGYAQPVAPDPVWSQPAPPPPRKRGNGVLIAVIAVLAVLVVGGAAAAIVKLGGSDDDGKTPVGQSTSEPATDPSAGESEAPSASQSPGLGASTDARFVKAGQCVVNQGTNQKPVLKIVDCGAKTFEVLARFDGTIDYETKCKTVEGYQFHYFFDSELNPLDFVLCLKQR
jgi:hypothetical protein